MENKKVVFCNVAWMKNYCGYNPKSDLAVGGGKYVDEHDGNCMEVNNFLIYNKKCYGYFMHYGEELKIERLGEEYKNASEVTDVTVVWVATNPDKGGRYIVGWYEHATMYRNWQFYEDGWINEEGHQSYNFVAESKNCYLIPETIRTHKVPNATENGRGKGMGQAQIWYADGDWAQNTYVPEVLQYLQSVKGKCQKLYNDFTVEELSYVAPDTYESMDDILDELTELENQDWYHCDTRKIIGLYNLAAAKEPGAEGYFGIGLCLRGIYYLDEAIEAFKKSLSLNTNNIDAEEQLFEIYYSLKMRTDAILIGEQMASRVKDEIKADVGFLFVIYYKLCLLYYYEGDHKKVAECIKRMKNVKFFDYQARVKALEEELAKALNSK